MNSKNYLQLHFEGSNFKSIEESWKEIGEGKFKKMKSEDFLMEISKW